MPPQAQTSKNAPRKKRPALGRKTRISRRRYRPEREADAVLVLEDGSVFWGKGAGAAGIAVGELCFNTAMSGYQEVMSDPSYAGQIINFTFPHIGNVGSNSDDNETVKPFAKGLVLTDGITSPSNYRAQNSFEDWLCRHKLIAVTNIDTRALTQRIRIHGAPRAVIAYRPGANEKGRRPRFVIAGLIDKARRWPGLKGMDLSKNVTTAKPYEWQQPLYRLSGDVRPQETDHQPHVVAIDYGAKQNILRHLVNTGLRVTVVPADFSAKKIMKLQPHGIFLSNGPGDPAATASYAVPILQELLQTDLPIFGICLGHQLLALSLGAKTEKMRCGHRGGNHPVKNIDTGAVEITSQNHGFHVMRESLPEMLRETHVSLFDNTLEGIALKTQPVFSVQYHPEASPGPHDSHYLFQKFAALVNQSMPVKRKATATA